MVANGSILNASSVPLNQMTGTLPNMLETILDWFQPMKAIVLVKTQVNFLTVERGVPVYFQGVIQPITGRELQMRPEGQRAWDLSYVHATPALALKPDDIFWIQNTAYRVMKKRDFTAYGYIEYTVRQDYQDRAIAPPVPNEDDLARFTQDISLTDDEVLTIDVSATIPDAFGTIWKVLDLDNGNTPVIGAIQVLSETSIQITAPAAGNFRILGGY